MAKKKTSTPAPESTAAPEIEAELGLPVAADSYSPVPGSVRKPKKGFTGSMLWIYGAPGVGKTSLAAEFPGTWFIATEPGQDYVTIREPTFIDSWASFIELCVYIQENKPTKFKDGSKIETIAIDTVDRLFRMCQDYVCQGLGVEDPGELPHGKGWSRLANEFGRVIGKVALWPYTLVCISHERQKEFKARSRSYDRYEPEIGAAGMRELGAAADFIFRLFMRDEAELAPDGSVTGALLEKRFIQLQPSGTAMGKNRDKRNPALEIPLDFKTLVHTLENS